MQFRSGNDIRETFLRFFESKGHKRVHSSSLVPANDPTLLFTNAGMNQFKDVFLGIEQRDYKRATTSQKCVRAGGKHNDLENVGFTRRHHTFFEMLGNFSFGDYFKRDAIAFAWELVTSPDWLDIPKDKLYVTIFEGDAEVPRDDEAEQLWVEAGVPKDRIHGYGRKDNFWQMGDTGPCGPCSEIFYDMGIAATGHFNADGTAKDLPFGQDDARYVEIWNLVFMQFDRARVETISANGKTPEISYELRPLPKPSIDTGAGLERMAAVLQGVLSNFETDLFTPLIARASELTGYKQGNNEKKDASLRIIADHARAATFLISDGVNPANEGRGYVLRKILRRGIRHGRLLGEKEPFMHEMVFAVRDLMNGAYPELNDSADRVSKVVLAEERQFARVLEAGAVQLDNAISKAGDLSGGEAFHLYETYGLPLDFMQDAARDAGIEFDLASFESARQQEQARARASWKGGSKQSASPAYRDLPKTQFLGYNQLTAEDCEVLALVKDGIGVPQLMPGDHAEVVLNHTSFYADSGGQVGDHGWLYSGDGNTVVADVTGCTKPVQGIFAHKIIAKQPIQLGDRLNTVVDPDFRASTIRNHTGTHLLHAALRETLGTHVKQAGSLVDPQHLRFDFSHFQQVADEELQDIEDIANQQILRNTRVEVFEDVPIDVAVNELHAMALFGEKYGDRVRVVKIGDFSTELCGGTHTAATGEIGLLKLLGESGVSSGVRRLEAVSGLGSLAEFRRDYEVARLAEQVAGSSAGTTPAASLRAKLQSQDDELKKLRRELEDSRMKSAASAVSGSASQAVEVNGVKVLAQRVPAVDRGQMRTLVDNLRQKLGSGVVVLGSVQPDGKVALIVGVTKDLTTKLQAGKIIAAIAPRVGGSGGGRPDLAEAGGKDASQLDAALASAPEVVAGLL
jgi:alanyl-tRNA synthetase